MAINIGNEATEALQELRNNPWFEKLINGLGIIAWQRVSASVQAPPELRVEQTSYARGIYDVWEGMAAAYLGVKPNEVKRPSAAVPRVGRTEPPHAA